MQKKNVAEIPDPVCVPAVDEQQSGWCLNTEVYFTVNPGLALFFSSQDKAASLKTHPSMLIYCSFQNVQVNALD